MKLLTSNLMISDTLNSELYNLTFNLDASEWKTFNVSEEADRCFYFNSYFICQHGNKIQVIDCLKGGEIKKALEEEHFLSTL